MSNFVETKLSDLYIRNAIMVGIAKGGMGCIKSRESICRAKLR